jgi:hypothetical protein
MALGVDSAFNRNEYQESSGGGGGGGARKAHNLAAMYRENVGALTPHNPMVLHGLLEG